ncbi:MAG: phytoene/squalene synthase family protein [Gemmataceae bacterium]
MTLSASYQYAAHVTRTAQSNFPLAFRLLGARPRRGMEALYAFLRLTDDLADEPAAIEVATAKLAEWQAQLHAALAGQAVPHPVFPALVDTVRRYQLEAEYFDAVLAGVTADLRPRRLQTTAELDEYCFQVAGAVGLLCLPIWGCRNPAAIPAAMATGRAFQRTNILRDLAEDLGRGRVYVPVEEWQPWGAEPEAWQQQSSSYQSFMADAVARTQAEYAQAEGLAPYLARDGQAIYRVMFGTYHELLLTIQARRYDVFTERVRLTPLRKLRHFLAGFWRKYRPQP